MGEMVDVDLPILDKDKRPLRILFLDLNSYFASCEQQEQPELRGRPIAVCPVMADTSFVIAASYEAKAFGVKTGTQIGEAKRMCPEIELVHARPPVYVAYHKKVLEVAESVLPIEEVCSIDEMRFRLIGVECEPENAVALAKKMKAAIREGVGEQMTCSVGIAPNSFLAKVGTDMQKPDGLVVLEAKDLPQKLFDLKLTDFAGINKKMQIRLNAAGIFTAQQMCEASRQELLQAFGSVVGERWYYLLRGYDLSSEKHSQKTMGHSHVLPPDLRTDDGCREVLLRLLHKAAARLRSNNLWASAMAVYVSGFKKSWTTRVKLPPTQDSVTLTEYFMKVWPDRDFLLPRSVGVTFTELKPSEEVTPSLFDATAERSQFNHAVDKVNQKFGKNKVFLAGMEHAKDAATEKIAFNKTWLFSEGKDDNEWEIDTFRGMHRDEEENEPSSSGEDEG
jgi:DNA polymerase-4